MTDQRSAKRYFAAANTQEGFVSFFDGVFFGEKIEKRYIIKGGPGTGKSSFLRRVAFNAHRQGREVEYYYCSSDTDSLDGIVVDGSIALFDGTSPHSHDTVLPGAIDELIDLGQFWDADALRKSKSEIRALGAQKSRAYALAYGYLGAAGALGRTNDRVIEPCVRTEKLRAAVGRMIVRLGVGGDGGERRIRQVSAFGVKGRVHLDTLEAVAKRKFYVEDHYGTACRYLQILAEMAMAAGARVDVSFDAPYVGRISEVYFPDTGDLFCAVENACEDGITVNMKRFVDADALTEVRFAYRTAKQAQDKIIGLAALSLAAAGELHAEIERYYVSAMDFGRLSAFCNKLSEKILA